MKLKYFLTTLVVEYTTFRMYKLFIYMLVFLPIGTDAWLNGIDEKKCMQATTQVKSSDEKRSN